MSAIVCFVRSFSALTPVWYTIQRVGTPKAQGGEGVTWTCTCPDYLYRSGPKGRPCKHLVACFQCAHHGVIPDNRERFRVGESIALLYPHMGTMPLWALSEWRSCGRPKYTPDRGLPPSLRAPSAPKKRGRPRKA